MHPPVTAVLFDYGQVLSAPPDPIVWQHLQSILHTTDTPFAAAYWAHRHDYDRGILTGVAYWHAVAADLHQPLAPAQLATLIAADTALWTQPNQPMIDWAIALQRTGIKTGILSNIGDEMEAGILAHFPFLQAFTHHTFSHRLLIAKPDIAIYHHAAAGLATPAAQILFLDDREENITAARAAGMQAIHYTTHKPFLNEMHDLGQANLLQNL